MSSGAGSFDDEMALAEACLLGEAAACEQFEERHRARTVKVLSARGATLTEAEDLTRNLLSDCTMGQPGEKALLSHYNGKCSLQSWLTTCATRRFIDLKRRTKRFVGQLSSGTEDEAANPFEAVAAPLVRSSEMNLVALLRNALEYALAACPVETRLMLRLVYIEGLTQREIARMWNYHESKVSRKLDQAMQAISAITLAEIRTLDPFLVLEWSDFLEMCESSLSGMPW